MDLFLLNNKKNSSAAYMLKRSGHSDIDLIVKEIQESGIDIKREHLIICRLCSSVITAQYNKISINGRNRHTFKNPSGNIFTIGCFLKAKGCSEFGHPTLEFTWFAGYSWLYAVCSSCLGHLGWFYRSGSDSFYGLISNNLIENI